MTQKSIILFQDKLGITSGYESIWMQLCLKAGLTDYEIHRRKTYNHFGDRVRLLEVKGNRKSPGFNTDPRVQDILRGWVARQIETLQPRLVLCMDPALGFLANPNWEQATMDNLRGGHYRIMGTSWVFLLSVSAWHQRKSQKDVAMMNDGFITKEEWEAAQEAEDESEDDQPEGVWLEPLTVPEGKFVLRADLAKASRILRKQERGHE